MRTPDRTQKHWRSWYSTECLHYHDSDAESPFPLSAEQWEQPTGTLLAQ